MEEVGSPGRTAIVYRVTEGVVVKTPRPPFSKELESEIDNAFVVEEQLLQRLGSHPRIVQYYGLHKTPHGLLLKEANRGDLHSYINENSINNALRRKWSLQIAEAVAYIHEKGIIHSNLSTTNILVHQTEQTLDLVLADFGGSKCLTLGLDGHLLPDVPYFDSQLTDFTTLSVDVFSLGVVIYIIVTGQYPFQEAQELRDLAYSNRVEALYKEGRFPNLCGVLFGGVIAGCCCERRFETAKEVVVALEAEMQASQQYPT